MLIRKMFRDLWKNKVPFIAIFLMMFAGNFIFSGITGEYHGMEESFDEFVQETRLADAWVSGDGFTLEEIEDLNAVPDIEQAERRLRLNALMDTQESQSLEVYVLDGSNQISSMEVVEGISYGQGKNGLWLDAAFAKENQIQLHDKIRLNVSGQNLEEEVVGLCLHPEYIYSIREGEMMPDHKKNGYAFLDRSVFQSKGKIPWNQLVVRGQGALDKIILDRLGRADCTVLLKEDHPSYSMIKDEVSQHREIGLLFAFVFLFLALLVTITTVHRLLNSQRLQIGILKALGYQKNQLYRHYVSHSTVVCLAASLLGGAAGYKVLPGLLFPLMGKMYTLPNLQARPLPLGYLLPVLCGGSCLILSLGVCRNYLAENAAKILYSNTTVRKYQTLPLEGIWSGCSFRLRWNLRDILRNRLRSVMTVLGVLGCVALLLSSLGLYTSMNHLSHWNFQTVQTFDAKVSGDFRDGERKAELLKYMEGEELMEASVELSFDGRQSTGSFTGLESQRYIHLMKSENEEVFLEEGSALSKQLAEELGVEKGDVVQWKFLGDGQWYESKITEIVRTPVNQGLTMTREEMDRQGIPFLTTSILGREPENSMLGSDLSLHTKADMEANLNSILEASVTLFAVFFVAALLLGSVILYNLGSLFYMERYRDMATLKVLGFPDSSIQRLMVQQNLWLAFVGTFLGIPGGLILLQVMFGTIQASLDISVYLPLPVYGISILGTILLTWLINRILSRKVRHIDMVAALKANE